MNSLKQKETLNDLKQIFCFISRIQNKSIKLTLITQISANVKSIFYILYFLTSHICILLNPLGLHVGGSLEIFLDEDEREEGNGTGADHHDKNHKDPVLSCIKILHA